MKLCNYFGMIRFLILLSLSLSGTAHASPSFDLVDTHPNSPEFKQRFYGSFGINSAIEPILTQADRPLYESIAPYLQNKPEKAIELAKKGITKTSNAAFDYLVGSLYYIQGNYSDAASYLNAALKKFPDFRRAHRNLALIYIQQDNYETAIKHLLRVIELGGGDGQSYSMLAYAYLTEEKYQSALSAYQLARMFLPDSIDVRRGEAQCLLMTQQYGAAIALFDELISEHPDEQDYWLFQANGYLSQNQVDDAIANLEIAHTVAPPSASSLSLLGDMYLNEDAHELALYNYQASLKQDPTTRPEQALKPLRRLMQLGLFDAARTYLKLIDSSLQSELSPEQAAEKTVVAAQLTIEAGNLEQGLAQLQSVLNEQPLNGDALLLIANVQLDQEAYATATFYFERATSVVEVQVEALVGLARTAVAQSRFQAALKHLQQSQRIKQRPDVAQFMASIEKVIAAQ